MNKEDVISEIKKDYEKSQSGIFLLSVSCVLMCLGLLGIAIYPEYTVFGIIVFAIGAAILFLTVFTDRHSAKKADALYVESFVVPEIAKHLNGVKSEKFVPSVRQRQPTFWCRRSMNTQMSWNRSVEEFSHQTVCR